MQNRIAALCFLAMAGGLAVAAPGLGVVVRGQPGPGLLPLVLSVVTAGLAVALFFQPVDDAGVGDRQPDRNTANQSRFDVTKLVAMTAGGLVAAPYLGLTVAIAWTAGAPLALLQRRRIRVGLLFGCSVATVIRMLFGELLGIPFPQGLLGF